MLNNIKALIKSILLIIFFFTFIPVACFTYYFVKARHTQYIQICFCVLLKILSTKVSIKGQKKNLSKGSLVVSNHISYLDIMVIGSNIDVRFTPKSEIKKWPIVGFLTNLSRPIYIERSPSKASKQKDIIRQEIKAGSKILVFPEGTTSNGLQVLPFKSSLFSVTEMQTDGDTELATINVQPIMLKYTSINSKKFDSSNNELVAWCGDKYLLPHLWEMLKLSNITAEIEICDIVELKNFNSRKELANHCQSIISERFRCN